MLYNLVGITSGASPQRFRLVDESLECDVKEHAGWHFIHFGDLHQINRKLQSNSRKYYQNVTLSDIYTSVMNNEDLRLKYVVNMRHMAEN